MKNSIFQKLRRPGSNRSPLFYIFSAIIFGMIIITFVFMSPNGPGNLSGSATAATVGGRVIPILQLQQRTQQIEEQNRMFLPNGTEQFQKIFQSQALNDLINAELLTEVEPVEELYVSDSLLAKTIMDIPSFQEKGQFKRDLYENYLLNSGMSANSLEERIKKDLRIGIVRDLFNEAFVTTKAENEIFGQIKDFDIKMEFVDVSEKALSLNQTPILDAEIKSSLEKPEFLKQAQSEYEKTAFKYKSKDKVKAKWIFALASDLSEASFDKAKAKIAALDLNSKNFSEMAKLHSEDPTANQGGELGFVEKGTYDEAWDTAAFSTPVGSISSPFKTEQGWARILVEEKKTGEQQSFEDVKFIVAKEVLTQQKSNQLLAEIKKALQDNPESLNKTLSTSNLKWVQATDFKLSSEEIPGFGKNEDLIEKVISLKADGDIHPEILTYDGKSFLIKRKSLSVNEKASQDYQKISGNRQNYSLGNWFKAQKEIVRIKINPILDSDQKLF